MAGKLLKLAAAHPTLGAVLVMMMSTAMAILRGRVRAIKIMVNIGNHLTKQQES